MYDLDIFAGDELVGAVEVTADIIEAEVALWKHFNGDEPWIVPGLVGGWQIHVSLEVARSGLREQIVELLRGFEPRGVNLVQAGSHPRTEDELLAKATAVTWANQGPTNRPGVVYVLPDTSVERTAGCVAPTADSVGPWVGGFLAAPPRRSDVVRKLRASGAPRRHAFVVVSDFSAATFAVQDSLRLNDVRLPSSDPSLPDGITEVWLASTWAIGVGVRWSECAGWSTFDKEPPGFFPNR
jgi:hypothetical protein